MSETQQTDLAEMEAQQLALLNQEMAEAAAEMQKNLVISNNRISNQGKQFKLPDGTQMGPTLEVVILGYIKANSLFKNAWDPNKPEAPSCFAYAMPGEDYPLIPSEKVEKPESDVCITCMNNDFGTAANKKGKACKNEYQVAVIVPVHSESEVMTLSISATGMKGFDSSLGGAMKVFGHTAQAILNAEFTDAVHPVVKITGGKANPNALQHFKMAKEAVHNLLNQ